MSRLLNESPETKTGIVKINDDEHEIFHIEVTRLGRTKKTPEGWSTGGKELFPQEQDAIEHMYAERGWPFKRAERAWKPKVKIHDVRPTEKQVRLAGFVFDMRVHPFNEFKYFRTTRTKKSTKIEACKSLADREKGAWIFLGETDSADASG